MKREPTGRFRTKPLLSARQDQNLTVLFVFGGINVHVKSFLPILKISLGVTVSAQNQPWPRELSKI